MKKLKGNTEPSLSISLEDLGPSGFKQLGILGDSFLAQDLAQLSNDIFKKEV